MAEADDDGALAEPAEKKHVCPECGESFALAMQLGLHRRNAHGIAGTTAKKKRGVRTRGTRAAPTEGRKVRVRKTLVELADLSDDMRGRGGTDLPAHLADVIRRDADQLATVITFAAEKADPIKWFVDTILVQIVAPVVGASGVVRWFFRRMRDQAAAREAEQGVELTPDELAWRDAPPEPGVDTAPFD